ncbi:hypothetical protein N9C85_00975 [Synechococcus sp. AH-224-I15]|nr:hypothetical protein [Synechococcus sp. AH-224-I15]
MPHPQPDARQLIAEVLEASDQRDVFSNARFTLVRELRIVCGGDQARVTELLHGILHGWRCAEDEAVRLLEGLYADAGRA